MLVVLYCYMRKFRTCEPPEQYLLCTFSADMCPCTKSGIFCGLCPYCAQTNCRRTMSVLCRLGWNAASKVCRSARVRVRSAYTLIPSISHTMFCFHTCLACLVNQAMSPREGAAEMCAEYTFLKRRKKRPKYLKLLWTRRKFRQETTFFGS